MPRPRPSRTAALAALLLAALPAAAGARAAAVAPCEADGDALSFRSEVLGEMRRVNVYLPPGYEASPTRRYPVLYMPDGGLDEDFPHVACDVDAAIRAGAMAPVLVVGIANTQRRRDMTGPTTVEDDRAIAPMVGGSAAFRAFLREELLPRVDASYRTARPRAIIGESLAGLFVLETLLLEPELFDAYVSLSPSLWWNAGALVRDAGASLARMGDGDRFLLLVTAGDDGLEDASRALDQALRAQPAGRFRWTIEHRPDLVHANIYVNASPGIFPRLFPPAGR